MLSDRSMGAIAGAESLAAGLPVSMAELGAPAYRYVLLQLGWITVTKRSLNLALAISGLSFVALQSASLCLVTTRPERLAQAMGRALRPLGIVGLPVKELVLTVLLALRFMATVSAQTACSSSRLTKTFNCAVRWCCVRRCLKSVATFVLGWQAAGLIGASKACAAPWPSPLA